MSIFNKSDGPKKKMTKGFSELNKRTYEASPAARGKEEQKEDFAAAYRRPKSNNINGPKHHVVPLDNQGISSYSRNSAQAKYAQQHIKHRKRKRIKIAAIVIASIIAFLAAAALAFFILIGGNLNAGMQNLGLTPTSKNQPFYMLLMGVDSSEERKANGETDENFRSDSIILTRIDPVDKKVTMMSLQRDVEVDMGEYGYQKLNAAHSLGGPQLCIKCAKDLCGVDINNYAEANFEGFASAVDDLGGVEVDVPININDPLAGGSLKKGKQTLNGQQALILCRSRHSYDNVGPGDVYRAANQRMVLTAIAKKALEADVFTLAKTISDLSKYIKTDMSIGDIIGLAQRMKDIDIEHNVYSAMMPTENYIRDGVSYEKVDWKKFREMMKRMDKGEPPTDTVVDPETGVVLSYSGGQGGSQEKFSGDVAVRNGTINAGYAAKVADRLSKLGFNTDAKDANSQDYNETVIVIRDESQRAAAEKIRDVLGCGQIKVNDNNEYIFTTDILVVIGKDLKI